MRLQLPVDRPIENRRQQGGIERISLAKQAFLAILGLAGGQNSASCGVVVGASVPAKPYIHWLFFSGGGLGFKMGKIWLLE